MSKHGFINKLHQLLNESHSDDLCWIDNTSFQISRLDEPAIAAMNALSSFKYKKLAPFIRQLSYYEFKRLSDRRKRTLDDSADHIVFLHPSGFFRRDASLEDLAKIPRKRRVRPTSSGSGSSNSGATAAGASSARSALSKKKKIAPSSMSNPVISDPSHFYREQGDRRDEEREMSNNGQQQLPSYYQHTAPSQDRSQAQPQHYQQIQSHLQPPTGQPGGSENGRGFIDNYSHPNLNHYPAPNHFLSNQHHFQQSSYSPHASFDNSHQINNGNHNADSNDQTGRIGHDQHQQNPHSGSMPFDNGYYSNQPGGYQQFSQQPRRPSSGTSGPSQSFPPLLSAVPRPQNLFNSNQQLPSFNHPGNAGSHDAHSNNNINQQYPSLPNQNGPHQRNSDHSSYSQPQLEIPKREQEHRSPSEASSHGDRMQSSHQYSSQMHPQQSQREQNHQVYRDHHLNNIPSPPNHLPQYNQNQLQQQQQQQQQHHPQQQRQQHRQQHQEEHPQHYQHQQEEPQQQQHRQTQLRESEQHHYEPPGHHDSLTKYRMQRQEVFFESPHGGTKTQSQHQQPRSHSEQPQRDDQFGEYDNPGKAKAGGDQQSEEEGQDDPESPAAQHEAESASTEHDGDDSN